MKAAMAVENLAEVIDALTTEEQESVRLFVEFRKRRGRLQHRRFSRQSTSSWSSILNCFAAWLNEAVKTHSRKFA